MTNKERYQQLCQAEPSICVYDQPWWMDAVCGAENWDVLLYEKKGNLLGAMPYYVRSRYGLKYITQPQLTQHNGVWIKYPEGQKYEGRLALEKEVMTALIGQLEALPVCYYQQNHAPSVTNWLPFYWKHYQQTTRYTYQIPWQPEYPSIFGGFSKVVRKNIEKAAPLAAIWESDDVERFYELNRMTFARQHMEDPVSLEFLRRFDQAAAAHNARKIYFAADGDGTVHCASYIVFDQNWVYQLMSGTDPRYRSSEFKTLLIDKAIRFAWETGRGFDFEGSMVPGIEEFFRKFGAIQTPYFSIRKTYTKNPLLRAAINQKMQ